MTTPNDSGRMESRQPFDRLIDDFIDRWKPNNPVHAVQFERDLAIIVAVVDGRRKVDGSDDEDEG